MRILPAEEKGNEQVQEDLNAEFPAPQIDEE